MAAVQVQGKQTPPAFERDMSKQLGFSWGYDIDQMAP